MQTACLNDMPNLFLVLYVSSALHNAAYTDAGCTNMQEYNYSPVNLKLTQDTQLSCCFDPFSCPISGLESMNITERVCV